jgi:O-antigen/teichoic acid export membrane protein
MYGGLPDAVFKATGRYPAGTMLAQAIRIAEWGGSMLGLALFRNFAGVAIGALVAKGAGTAAAIYLSQQGGHELRLGFRQASRAEFFSMIRPAVSLMAFPLAFGLSFQGVTLLVGALAGTSAVALFNTYRTIARVAVQLTGMFSHAAQPEFSLLYGKAGIEGVRNFYRQAALLSAAQSVGLSVVLFFVSPLLLQVWTHGRIGFEPTTMIWLLAYAAAGGVWHVPRILLLATNQHIGLSVWLIVSGVLSVSLGWLFGTVWQVNGISAAMFVSESFIAAVCIYVVHRLFAEARPKSSTG